MQAYRIEGMGETLSSKHLWETHRNVPQIPSPLLYQGHLFVLRDSGILAIIEPATGDELKQIRLPGRFVASLVAGNGKVYAVSEDTTTFVLEANPTLNMLATNELNGVCFASPAIHSDYLILRTKRELIAIGPEDMD